MPPLPVLVVVIDEFAELFKMMGREIEESLDQICRQGRAYWVHLLDGQPADRHPRRKADGEHGVSAGAADQDAAGGRGDRGAERGEPQGFWAVLLLKGSVDGTLTKFQGEFLWREYRKPGTEDFDDGAPARRGRR